MEFRNNRVQDISQVFDRNWNINHNNSQRKKILDSRKEHFNKMYNIQDKNTRREELLKANSVNGQVQNLNERMQSMNNSQRITRMNEFKNNFR